MVDLLHANDASSGYPPSWYAATAEAPPEAPPLRGEVRADVAVIGAGFTGLSAALAAAEGGAGVVLIDARRVGWGASGRNGGQVGSGQRLDVLEMEAAFGLDRARALWALGEAAKAETKRLVETHAPEAGWMPGIAHLDRRAKEVPHAHAVAERLAAVYGYDAMTPLNRAAARALSGSPAVMGGALDRGAAHLHPLRLAFGLARACEAAGVRLHEGSRAHRIDGTTVLTERGRIVAERVILAGNGYVRGLDARTEARVMPINNFIVATEPVPGLMAEPVAAYDSHFVVNYWRQTGDHRLLFGGGETWGYRFPKDIAALVRKPMETLYPQLKGIGITHAWGGTLAITRSRLPLLHAPRPGILSASGYSGHGVALACYAGRLAAEASLGRSEGWAALSDLDGGPFPGGGALRTPLLMLAMGAFALRDRLGI